MGFFKKQFANVVEWNEFRDDMIFWKWNNNEIKKGSRLILKPGQDAIFLNNGKIEGIFSDDGDYDIQSEIIPFLSSLKGFKFGFNSGLRVEVVFVNTKEFAVKWGTKSAINIPTPNFPGGMPIRANGMYYFKLKDYTNFIENLSGIKTEYYVEDIKERISAILDQLLMKWIVKEGKDMFNLQANSLEIGEGIKKDLDYQIFKDGLKITNFNIMSFSYPEEIQKMINKNASNQMIGDMNRYTEVAMADSFGKGNSSASNMAEMMMGMKVAEKMMNNSEEKASSKFCSNCGTKTNGGKFCSNCGNKLD